MVQLVSARMKLPDEDRQLPGKPKPPPLPRIPTAPKPPPVAAPKPSPGGGGGGNKTPKDPYADERKKAEKRQRKTANNNARRDATEDLTRLNAEIRARKAQMKVNTNAMDALQRLVSGGEGSHDSVRNSVLAGIEKSLASKIDAINETFAAAMGDFNTDLRSNEQAEADATFSNLSNRARERGDLMTQALSQGAGESDVLRTQQQALRNWSANQAEVNRSFFDTRNSVNAAISDLNTSTKTGLINEELSANASKAKAWDDYFESMASTYADLANYDQNNYLLDLETQGLREQKSQTKDVLNWLDKGKNIEDYKPGKLLNTPSKLKYTSPFAHLSAEMSGSSWEDPGLSQRTENWQGGAQSTGGLNTANKAVLSGNDKTKRPEGATLRRW